MFAGALALVLLGGAGAVAASANADRPVATVGGLPVSAAEARFYEDLARSTGDISDARGDDAARIVLERIASDRALLDLARERGLTDARGYDDLMRLRDRRNAEQASRVTEGEIAYGLTTYSPDQFVGRTLSELRTALREQLAAGADPALAVADQDIADYFDAHRTDWAAAASTYEVTRMVVPATAGISDEDVSATVRRAADLDRMVEALLPGSRIDRVAIGSDGLLDGDPVSPDTLRQLQTLDIGGLTDVETWRGGWRLFRLEAVAVDEEAALRTYAPRIRTVLQDARLDALLAELAAGKNVTIDHAAWDAARREGKR